MEQLNPVSLLTEISSCQKTGCLNVNTNKDHSVSWKIYFRNGEFQYAETSAQSLEQFQYIFVKNGWNDALSTLKNISSQEAADLACDSDSTVTFYEKVISSLQKKRQLDSARIQRLMEEISQDSLESFLWLTEGNILWQEGALLPTWITVSLGSFVRMDLSDMLGFLQQRLKGWQACAKALNSPHQRPYLVDFRDINRAVPDGSFSAEILAKLAALMRRGLSLRQLSLYLKQDELHVAQLLSPYIRAKLILLRSAKPPFDQLPAIPAIKKKVEESNSASQANKFYKIICIDDSPTVLGEMKRFLGDRFDVTAIDDPVLASASIFRLKPDLILMDITMPRINGYRLCSLLRKSSAFDDTPIIMVSGNTGLIDKARAKMSGATDYLTKPFNKSDLLDITTKYLEPI